MKRFTVHDINKKISNKAESAKMVYEKVLDSIFTRIERGASVKQLWILYQVPEFLLGLPLVNINECIGYVIEVLTAKGFLVNYYFPNTLYISWNKEEIKYLQVKEHMELASAPQQLQLNTQIPMVATLSPLSLQHHDNSMAMNQIKQTTQQAQPSSKRAPAKNTRKFIKSISEFKPSGKFSINLN